MVGNGSRGSEKLRETLADMEGTMLSQLPALRKLNLLVNGKGAGKSHLTRTQQQRQNEHTRIAGTKKVGLL